MERNFVKFLGEGVLSKRVALAKGEEKVLLRRTTRFSCVMSAK
jgi:hypothetical protein